MGLPPLSPAQKLPVKIAMSSKTPWVMFGHNRLIGDYAEIIHSNGGVLTRIVQNMEEKRVEGRKSLAERLEGIASIQGGLKPAIEPIETFCPEEGEKYLIGFAGYQMQNLRDLLVERFNINFTPMVHPSVHISSGIQIPPGCIINARAVIASNVQIEAHVFINRNASIGHDSTLSKFSIVQPGANLAGHIMVGEGAVIGIGATVIEDQSIGHHAMVAAGAVVTRQVPPGMLVAGVPATVKKQIYPAMGSDSNATNTDQ